MKSRFWLLLIWSPFLLFAQEFDRNLPEFDLNELDQAGKMYFLASDFLQGRRTGSPGNEIAANYIASQLHADGYAPINGESYFQPVPLRETASTANGELTDGEEGYTQHKDLLIIRGPAAAAFGLTVIDDPALEQRPCDWSDNVRFSAKGVPSLSFSPDMTEFNDDIFKYYHQVTDNL
ncbi:MAG: hypothetical protein AAFZ52_13750, partial [Bacteroidota bacterium]